MPRKLAAGTPKNVAVQMDDDKKTLWIEVDTSVKPWPSTSGGSMLIATTSGMQDLADMTGVRAHKGIVFSLNLYRPATAADKKGGASTAKPTATKSAPARSAPAKAIGKSAKPTAAVKSRDAGVGKIGKKNKKTKKNKER
jgi:hypothetical protein